MKTQIQAYMAASVLNMKRLVAFYIFSLIYIRILYLFNKNNPAFKNQDSFNPVSFSYRMLPIIPVYDIQGNYGDHNIVHLSITYRSAVCNSIHATSIDPNGEGSLRGHAS